ncbi:hypothetical protein GF382_00035 [Candidatus Falkowbacteria bacterium]|nr:hypothetical protein [Candidatus Falkowbacteria bacterium]
MFIDKELGQLAEQKISDATKDGSYPDKIKVGEKYVLLKRGTSKHHEFAEVQRRMMMYSFEAGESTYVLYPI